MQHSDVVQCHQPCLPGHLTSVCVCRQEKVPYDLANRPGNEEAMRLLIAACIDRQMALRDHTAKGSC